MPSLRNGLLLPLPALLACGSPCEQQPENRSLGGPRQTCRSLVETTEPDPTTTTDTTTAVPECGNGVLESGEECDDGNQDNTDACTNACEPATCSDGFVQMGVEDCDEGGVQTADCEATCTRTRCGDTIINPLAQPPEQCDDGNQDNTDACTDVCELATCGDSIVQPPEKCDDGGVQTADCEATCTRPTCGDGVHNPLVLQPPEQCDNGTNLDPPYSTMGPPAPDACAPGCLDVEFCGDGIPNGPGPEPCDDGMQTAACETTCTIPTCGDGITNKLLMPPEQCDDNNAANGDGCSSTCLEERFVFVSPHLFFGDLSPNDNTNFPVLNPMLTGIARADAYCTAVANDPDRSYKAWLSDSTTHPAMRFDTTFSGLYRLLKPPDFPVIATGWQDLTDGTLSNPINAVLGDDNIVAGNIWTHTLPNGTSADPQIPPCADWTSKDPTAFVGNSEAADATWTKRTGPGFDGGVTCSDVRRIYCLQDLP
jgi:cysteine-rich repeat protein